LGDLGGGSGRYFIATPLVELPPESEPNHWIARHLFLMLAVSGVISPRLIDNYLEIGQFQSNAPIVSPTFPALTLTAAQIFDSV